MEKGLAKMSLGTGIIIEVEHAILLRFSDSFLLFYTAFQTPATRGE